jgi:hypothetical protein
VAQGVGPEFKPQYHTQKKKIKKISIIQIFPTLFFAVFQFEFRALNLLGRCFTAGVETLRIQVLVLMVQSQACGPHCSEPGFPGLKDEKSGPPLHGWKAGVGCVWTTFSSVPFPEFPSNGLSAFPPCSLCDTPGTSVLPWTAPCLPDSTLHGVP